MIKKYKKQSKKNIDKIVNIMLDYYNDAQTALNFRSPFELTVDLILAAQCTDKRVNEVSPILFSKYPTVYDMNNASIEDIMAIVKPCGFYRNKSKSIKETSKIICERYNGIVPDTMEELTSLCGIGRKSANIILQECFGKVEGIAVDTHVTRVSRKIGLSNGKTQKEIESDLLKEIDKKNWNRINLVFVEHGRNICIANRPKCDICPIKDLCNKND